MLVGEVYPLRVGELSGPLMLSAGNPVAGCASAAIEAQVSRAQRWILPRSTPPSWNDWGVVDAGAPNVAAGAWRAFAVAACADVARAVVRPTAAIATPPRIWRRVAADMGRLRSAVSVM